MKFALVFLGLLAFTYAENRGIVLLKGDDKASGEITITETPQGLHLEGHITGLTPGKHGFHIHQLGDLRKGCASTGGHFNPHNRTHGAPEDEERHAGDLGNVIADDKGEAHVDIFDKHISLFGEHCILGRAIVVHSGEDDLGKGGHKDSKTTGNAGGRVACGIIGILSESNGTKLGVLGPHLWILLAFTIFIQF